jgi:Na+/melibiose symporter-like transporter
MQTAFLAQVPRVLADVFRNPELRRVELAYAGFNAAMWGVWIAMLVYAYDQGGATTAGLVAVVQLVPAGLAAPFASVLADRRSPAQVLIGGYVGQAAAMAATSAALFLDAPPVVAYGLATLANTFFTFTRPSQNALLPSLARSPEELTATNVVSGWIESISVLAAPALTGVLLAGGHPGHVFAVMSVVGFASAVLVSPQALGHPKVEPAGATGTLHEAFAAFRLIAHEPSSRLLVTLLSAQFIAVGALDVLYVVLAIGVLALGDSGAGYLNAAFGAGGTLGIAATATLVGRRHLVPPLVLGVVVWSAAFVALGAHASTAGAFLLIAVAGAGRTVVDVAGRTLLQRTAPVDVLARVFGVVEGLSMAGLAVGSALVPLLVSLGGARAALFGVAGILPLLLVLTGRTLVRADASASVPVVEIALLRTSPIFAALPAPTLEGLAGSLEEVDVPAGEIFIRQGDHGDRFYLIADGQVEVEVDGTLVAVRRRSEGIGEIALLRDVPRTATARARTPLRLYAIDKEPFITVVTRHEPATRAADELIEERAPAPA